MATISDVARIAGVSVSTVSHVVNGTRPVSDRTRARVIGAIDQTGYSQDGVARALRRSKTESVGLVISDTGQPVFADMVRGVEYEARSAGFTLLLSNSAEDRDREAESIQALRERRVDGLIVAPVAGTGHSIVDRMRAWRMPLVLIDRLTAPDVDQVGVENHDSMKQLVEHVLKRGHRRVGYVSGDLRVPVLAERKEGFVDALASHRVPLDQALLVEGTAQFEDTAAAVRSLLRRPDRPTALIAASMVVSLGAMRALQEQGLEIPNDMAFAVFDEPAHADLFRPRLTSVVQPAFEIGREAMRLLLRRLADPDAPPRTERLRPVLVHRESCGCPAGTVAEWEVVPIG